MNDIDIYLDSTHESESSIDCTPVFGNESKSIEDNVENHVDGKLMY